MVLAVLQAAKHRDICGLRRPESAHPMVQWHEPEVGLADCWVVGAFACHLLLSKHSLCNAQNRNMHATYRNVSVNQKSRCCSGDTTGLFGLTSAVQQGSGVSSMMHGLSSP
jgi:hypothetical protein